MVVFGLMVIVFGQNGSIWANWFYLGKLVVIGQGCCIWVKVCCVWADGGSI